MALLQQFSPPGNLTELDKSGRAFWSDYVSTQMNKFPSRAQFFNPLVAGDPPPAPRVVRWPAFPGSLSSAGSNEERWRAADERNNQDEYCEWGIEFDGDAIARITFTTETPDYFEQMLKGNPDLCLSVYGSLVGRDVSATDLRDADGNWDPTNSANRSPDGKIAHLSEGSNNLFAAIALAAEATVLREKDGRPVTEKGELVECGRLGVASRNSDPQIAVAINQLAADGAEISLADPPGLYLDQFLGAGINTPDDADAKQFWQPTARGDAEHVMRAVFEVPPERGYTVSDLEIQGQPIRFGSQVAERVQVRLQALAQPGNHNPTPQPCEHGD